MIKGVHVYCQIDRNMFKNRKICYKFFIEKRCTLVFSQIDRNMFKNRKICYNILIAKIYWRNNTTSGQETKRGQIKYCAFPSKPFLYPIMFHLDKIHFCATFLCVVAEVKYRNRNLFQFMSITIVLKSG